MPGMLLFARIVVLGQLVTLPGMPKAVDAILFPKPAPASSVVPSTQPANVAKADSDNLGEAVNRLTITKLFKGEKKLSPGDLGHLQFWVGLVKEPFQIAVSFIPRLFVAAIFLLLFWGLNRGVRRIVNVSMGRAGVDSSISEMLAHLLKWGIMGFGIVVAFNQLGIQISGLLTGASIVGLAVGLAAQETLANFIAGIVIFWDKPFRVGDVVKIDDSCGTIQRVTFRSTRLLTFDGEIVVLPNTSVLAHKLLNHSSHTTGRINITVGISYNASIDVAREALLALIAGDDRIREDPAPAVVVSDLTETCVRLNFWFWSREKSGVAKLKFEYTEKTKKALDRAGIEIPVSRMQLTMPEKDADAFPDTAQEFRVAS